MRGAAAFLCIAILFSLPARAQSTNLTLLQEQAVRCLESVPDTVTAFRLEAPSQMPYLRTALVERWQQRDRTIYVSDDSTQAPATSVPSLAYQVDDAGVSYTRADDGVIRRTVNLHLRYTLTMPDGRLLRDRRCRQSVADTVARDQLAMLETETFPATQGEAPPTGGWHRYLEPTLLVAATAVGVFLFFSLRSERTESP